MISAEKVTKNYPNFHLNCSLNVMPGQIVGLIGENGAGKTTTFKLFLGLIESDGGIVLIDGVNPSILSSDVKQKFGTVLSESFFNDIFTVDEIAIILKGFYQSFDKALFLQQCDKFNLPTKKSLKDFSTGMKAKIKTLVALSHHATILILDEPTSGLDVSARNEVIDMLHDYIDLNPDACILISSHISSDLEKICDTICYMKDGEIILTEETNNLLDEYGLIQLDSNSLDQLDNEYLLLKIKTPFGWNILTNQLHYFKENYPNLVINKVNLDDVLLAIMKGERL